METVEERVELLKWVTKNLSKVEGLAKKLTKLIDEKEDYPQFQDISLRKALSDMESLVDRMQYLDKQIDSPTFINTGKLNAPG